MTENDKTEFLHRVNGLMEVFGKPKMTAQAAQVWWDTVRDLDNNDAFTVLGYWAQTNAKPPTPRDVWTAANDARTERIERKAQQERAENRGDCLPACWHPTEYGRKMVAQLKAMAGNHSKNNTRPEKIPISMRRHGKVNP